MSSTRVYDAQNSFVGQRTHKLHEVAGDWGLYKVVDIYLLSMEWVPIVERVSTEGAEEKFTKTFNFGYTVTDGGPINDKWTFTDSFKEFSFTYNGNTQKFSGEYTQPAHPSYPSTYTVRENSSYYLYQQKFTFRVVVWFLLDAWGGNWVVGNWKSDDMAKFEGVVEYGVERKAETTEAKSTREIIGVGTAPRPYHCDQLGKKSFDEMPTAAQGFLQSLGV